MDEILRYKNFYAKVHFSAADEVFYGKILGVDDLIFEGSSVKGLKAAFKEAVEDYLETCKEIEKTIL